MLINLKHIKIARGIAIFVILGAMLCSCHNNTGKDVAAAIALTPLDQPTLDSIKALDKQNHDVTFVLVNKLPGTETMHNRVLSLPPIGNDLRIDMNKYLHKGHDGPIYIILPNSYAGPKEKFIMKSFPAYKGWYGSMLSDKFVMYAAK